VLMDRVRSSAFKLNVPVFRDVTFKALNQCQGFSQLRQANSSVTFIKSAQLEPQDTTIAVWIKSLRWDEPTATALVTKRVATDSGYFLFVLTTSRTIHFDWGGTSTRWNTGYEPPLNKWIHICVTRDSDVRKLFINGYQQAETNIPGNPLSVPCDSNLFIGKNTTAGGYQYKGDISRFMFWDRALTADDVRRVYEGAVIMDGLNIFCPFQSNSLDVSGNNNHGESQSVIFKRD